jgi:hypothetical protein
VSHALQQLVVIEMTYSNFSVCGQALGIATEGKSAEQLSTLITDAATKTPPNVIDPHALSKHFEEGRFTDCTIRVMMSDDRPAKRAKTGRRKGPEANVNAAEAGDVRVIHAHALVLASRSAYFERAMGGEWRESQDRSFEVEVSDETGETLFAFPMLLYLSPSLSQSHRDIRCPCCCLLPEYVTFHRLIKLCYGTTFIKEGDRDLDVSELVRLIHMANAFECMDAVKECATALNSRDLDWEGAVQCLELTDMLKGVEGMGGLAKKAAGVVAKEAGPVHALFTPLKDHEDGQDGGDVLGGLRLSEKVKVRTHNLSIHASTDIVLRLRYHK